MTSLVFARNDFGILIYFCNNLASTNILEFLRFSFFVQNLTLLDGQKIDDTKKNAIFKPLQITMRQKKELWCHHFWLWLLVVNYFCKTLHLRYLIEFWTWLVIRLAFTYSNKQQKHQKICEICSKLTIKVTRATSMMLF